MSAPAANDVVSFKDRATADQAKPHNDLLVIELNRCECKEFCLESLTFAGLRYRVWSRFEQQSVGFLVWSCIGIEMDQLEEKMRKRV
ncbi:hypothetical protein F2Q70_00029549 [Brassica cretica]|uniref:Uncharacterized protein n=1 Tax=Brassica cretica TaxID=69181 RepID=A0A8S9FGT6_BRACR|nr:hypothetical protein F2Q70_00029549 [Brassica cretica]